MFLGKLSLLPALGPALHKIMTKKKKGVDEDEDNESAAVAPDKEDGKQEHGIALLLPRNRQLNHPAMAPAVQTRCAGERQVGGHECGAGERQRWVAVGLAQARGRWVDVGLAQARGR